MKEINVALIEKAVAGLCIEANKELPSDIKDGICAARCKECNALAKSVLKDLERNLESSRELNLPICQDTGMAVVFLEVGQDVHLVGGDLYEAVNRGVAEGYLKGFLRKSIVGDPLKRENTGDNTPAVIHTRIAAGDEIKITVAPKGFGSENMSGIKMLTPFDGRKGVVDAVLEIVKNASDNPCPPMIIGVGIGGDFEQCAYLSKQALLRSINERNNDPYYRELEEEILSLVNNLNIGPQGFGGDTTALAVNIETAPTHIAGLPVAVNIGCHVTRHKSTVIK